MQARSMRKRRGRYCAGLLILSLGIMFVEDSGAINQRFVESSCRCMKVMTAASDLGVNVLWQ